MSSYTLKNRVGVKASFTDNVVNNNVDLCDVFENTDGLNSYIRNMEQHGCYEDAHIAIEQLYTIAAFQRYWFVVDNDTCNYTDIDGFDDGPYFETKELAEHYCLLNDFEMLLDELADEFYVVKNKPF